MNRVLVLLITLSCAACDSSTNPRPIGHMRIDLPEPEYAEQSSSCPYAMETPGYSLIRTRLSNDSACWTDWVFPEFRATVHLTYRPLNGNLAKLLDESLGLTYEHHIMADNIENTNIIDPDRKVYGTTSYVTGNVASHVQFYLTDSSHHFLRGALYFGASPNKDSIAPVLQHVQKDIDHMLSTIRWKDGSRP